MPIENYNISKNANGKFTKKIENIEHELTNEQVLNEYIGTLRNEEYHLEELAKTRKRKEALAVAYLSILQDLDAAYSLTISQEKASPDQIKALEDIKRKVAVYEQVLSLKV